MLYWSFTDDLSIVIMVIYAVCVYMAYSLTRMTGGAPTGWYVIIASFVLVIVRRLVVLYFDVQSPTTTTAPLTDETILSVLVGLLFAAGLFMLNRTFRRQLMLARETRMQP